MSADNYLYVRKREDGRFGISMRFASCYYADEGHTVESLREADRQAAEFGATAPSAIDESWIAQPPEDRYGVFDNLDEAVMAAHACEQREGIVEYGVVLGCAL